MGETIYMRRTYQLILTVAVTVALLMLPAIALANDYCTVGCIGA